jgi:hypothetical protein
MEMDRRSLSEGIRTKIDKANKSFGSDCHIKRRAGRNTIISDKDCWLKAREDLLSEVGDINFIVYNVSGSIRLGEYTVVAELVSFMYHRKIYYLRFRDMERWDCHRPRE